LISKLNQHHLHITYKIGILKKLHLGSNYYIYIELAPDKKCKHDINKNPGPGQYNNNGAEVLSFINYSESISSEFLANKMVESKSIHKNPQVQHNTVHHLNKKALLYLLLKNILFMMLMLINLAQEHIKELTQYILQAQLLVNKNVLLMKNNPN